jgi:putative inorganic carbon (hco3(-)) transporter
MNANKQAAYPRSSEAVDGRLARLPTPLALAGMALGLAIFYRASFQLPISALGLAIFAAFALLRPDLGLLFVPLSAPLYLMPKGIWDERFGIRPEGLRVPLHEAVLLATLAVTLLREALGLLRGAEGLQQAPGSRARRPVPGAWLREHAPVALFLAAGTLGVLLALPDGRGEALRQWRWLIVEPLIFYGLARHFLARSGERYTLMLCGAFALAGAAVAAIGLLQYVGRDLTPLIGQRMSFVASVVEIDGVRRVTSVYGHPNNLGLFLGRVWPVALALGWIALAERFRTRALLWLGCALLALAGLLLTYSRGANMAALAAGAVLGWGLLRAVRGGSARWVVLLGLGLLAALLLVMFRDDPASGSVNTRLLLWGEALRMLRDHPLGVGLGQFFFYHNPEFGHGYIAPQLVGTSEQFAAHPHNLPLDLYLNLGPLGLIAVAWLLLRIARRGVAAQFDAAFPAAQRILLLGLLAGLAAALVHGAVDNFYFVPDLALFFWGAAAISMLYPPTKGLAD